ncbi:MAG: sporulation protein YqfD [Firmicutes bacterium]|nr:sporulation protein YqfD [Bacillota bacterium]
MFFAKIFHFLNGYVILSVTGNNKEKFISKSAESGYKIFDIEYEGDEIRAKMPLADYRRILELAGIWKIKVNKRCGLPFFIARLKKKRGVLAVSCLFILTLTAGSQFIWSIDYDADKDVNIKNIETAAELAGLKIGAFKPSLKKPEEMKNIILNRADDICWCWVYLRGTKAVIRVRKSVIPPEIFDADTPCDIIAMRNGIIKRVITQKGRLVAENNQAVTAGETIISGTFDFNDTKGYQVHSKGIVEAYTNHTKSGTYKQYYCYKTYTGRVQRFLTLKLYKWQIPLYIKDRIRFENYDSQERHFDARIGRNNYIGIGLKINEIKEYETQKEPISYETAVSFAEKELERDISHELLQRAQLISKNCTHERIDEETVKVTVTMDFIEEIGTEKRIEEVNVIEPKNNQSAGGD